MPRFEPFPAIRYDLTRVDLAEVTAPPYDVIDAPQREALAARHRANVVAIDLPVGPDPYPTAAATMTGWLDEGILRREDPSFTVYRMTHTDAAGRTRHTTGVLGAIALTGPDEGEILPHEFTTPKARSDRLDLMRATGCQLSPVWVLSPTRGLTDLLAIAEEADATWTADDGVVHEIWTLRDEAQVDAIAAAVGAAPVVVADGHHRYETALTYRKELREAGNESVACNSMFVFVVELVDEELTVLPIHRLLTDVGDVPALVDALADFYTLSPAGPVDEGTAQVMHDQGCLTLVLPDRSIFLHPRAEVFEGLRPLDTVRLDHALAAAPPHALSYQHGIDNVRRAVAGGDADAGILVNPVTVAQILEIAHGGERMPPKTTFFHPKPVTGLAFRDALNP